MAPMRTKHHEQIELDDDHLDILQSESTEPQQQTYKFLNEMSLPAFEFENNMASSSTSEDATEPQTLLSPPSTPQRTSHGKRRDASYIPRPPNAFILFRSSFIRDQKVTNKVEGNHSNLSKIIGMYWKTLPKAQRDEWEAKAAQALLEHRRRYPDWRFRPGSTAFSVANGKVKDGPKRTRTRKDPPDKRGGDDVGDKLGEDKGKGKGKEDDKEDGRKEIDETRLTKIAGLLVEGKNGAALERAVEEWEAERGRRKSLRVLKSPPLPIARSVFEVESLSASDKTRRSVFDSGGDAWSSGSTSSSPTLARVTPAPTTPILSKTSPWPTSSPVAPRASASSVSLNSPISLDNTSSRQSRSRSRSPIQSSQTTPTNTSLKRSLSAPAPHREQRRTLSWQEEEDRRRIEVDHGFWWPSQQDSPHMGMQQMDMHEPSREGSFDFGSEPTSQEYEYTNAADTDPERDGWGWSGYHGMSYSQASTADQSSQLQDHPPVQEAQWAYEMTSSDPFITPWNTGHARTGESIHPLSPTPISPLHLSPARFSSSSSSLAGWDGTMLEEGNSNLSSPIQKVEPWDAGSNAWSGTMQIQTLGVQGGIGEWHHDS